MRNSGKLVSAASLMAWVWLLGTVVSPLQAQCPTAWKPSGGSWGVNGGGLGAGCVVEDAVVYDDGTGPALYVAGCFLTAGDVHVHNIAKWNGVSWSPLGDGLGDDTNGEVSCLAVHDGVLVAGGSFTTAGGVTANRIAKWDGHSWSPLQAGTNNGVAGLYPTFVTALAVYRGELIVGGSFTTAGGVSANSIARWNGTAWSPLGSGTGNGVGGDPQSAVYALTVHDDALFVGGWFANAGGISVGNIARWDGTAFSPLGSGMGGPSHAEVLALAVYDDALIAGGYFTTAGDVGANHVARWDGLSWSPLGAGVHDEFSPAVHDLATYKGELIAGGSFASAGEVSATGVARWDGSAWSALGSGVGRPVGAPPEVWSLAVYAGKLVAGGSFNGAGGVTADNIAQWDGTAWSPMHGQIGGGMDNEVDCLTVYNDRLIAGGWLHVAGGVSADAIVSWDGASFSPLGSGLAGGIGTQTLAVYNGKLIAGGWLQTAGGTSINNIGQWDGASWSPLGSGPDNGVVGNFDPEGLIFPGAFALSIYEGDLIVGGYFHSAGGASAGSIARWDGSTWSPLGSGVSGDGWRVSALAVYGDDLIAGGDFTTAGGVAASNIARWDGTSWSPLGGGVGTDWNSRVDCLVVYNGNLVAGGRFTTAGGVGVNNIAQWNGFTWAPLGSGPANGVQPYFAGVNTMTVYNGELIAAGGFTSAGGVSVNYIARWDGTSWSAMGTGPDNGLNGGVSALTVYNGELIVGGTFTMAGGQISYYWARWNPLAGRFIPADFNEDCHVDDRDMQVFATCATGPAITYDPRNLPFGCELMPDDQNRIAADLNADGFIDMSDFAAFQRCWSGERAINPHCMD